MVSEEVGLDHPTEAPIEAVAYLLGAIVKRARMKGAIGRLVATPQRAIISISDEVKYEQRFRWSVAHELGHLRLHRKLSNLELVTDSDATLAPQCDQAVEKEANAFAGELLMPSRLLERQVDVARPDLDIVQALADEYQVSRSAAAIRFVGVCPERCALVFAQGGKVKWTSRGPEFQHWIQPNARLDAASLAYDYFAKGLTPRRSEEVIASAWLSGDDFRYDQHELVEDCIVVPNMNATLSLLWIPASSEL